MTRRLLRTIRLDRSDTVVFATPADAGEWAAPGTFIFAGTDIGAAPRKHQIAFRTGFLGVGSFGFSTLAVVVEVGADDVAQAAETLAGNLMARLGAPDIAAARAAAAEEIAVSQDLARDHRPGTLVALHRSMEEGGRIRERFRTLRPRAETALADPAFRGHDRAFSIVETDEPAEGDHAPVDLVALLKGRSR